MIDSIVFYSAFSGTTYNFLGNAPRFPGITDFSEFIGPIFYSISNIKNANFSKGEFNIKSINYEIMGTHNDMLFFGLRDEKIGLAGLIKPQESNIFLESTLQIYNTLSDQSIIDCHSNDDLIKKFTHDFFKKIRVKNYFEEIKISSLKKDYKNYSLAILSSIKSVYGQDNLTLYSAVKEYLDENQEFIEISMNNKKRIEKILEEYNYFSKEKITMNSSILADYAKTEKILKIIKYFVCNELEKNKSINNLQKFRDSSELLEKINARFSLNEDLAKDLPGVILEIFESEKLLIGPARI